MERRLNGTWVLRSIQIESNWIEWNWKSLQGMKWYRQKWNGMKPVKDIRTVMLAGCLETCNVEESSWWNVASYFLGFTSCSLSQIQIYHVWFMVTHEWVFTYSFSLSKQVFFYLIYQLQVKENCIPSSFPTFKCQLMSCLWRKNRLITTATNNG